MVTDVEANDVGVHIDRAHHLGALFVQVPQNVPRHLPAAVLHHPDL